MCHQVAYTTRTLSVAKSATSVLWNHFVLETVASKEKADIQTAEDDFKITLKKYGAPSSSPTSDSYP